ncbi:MAG: presenilin family intramembrane aspartyl protease [Candidatus Anstonellaceae archaeon]
MDILEKMETKLSFLFFSSQMIAFLYFLSLSFLSIANRDFFENFSLPPLSEDLFSVVLLFLYIVFVALINIFFLKFFRSFILLKIFEFFALFFSLSLFFLPFLFVFIKDPLTTFIISLLVGLLLTFLKNYFLELNNPLVVISSATIGVLVGLSFSFTSVLIFAILLSLYDFFAVFKTRHMLTLAKAIANQKLAFAIASDIGTKIKTSKKDSEIKKPSIMLGSGDILLVSLFIPSTFIEFGLIPTISLILFSSIGTYILLVFTIKNKIALPALPFICFSSMFGLAISLILKFLF